MIFRFCNSIGTIVRFVVKILLISFLWKLLMVCEVVEIMTTESDSPNFEFIVRHSSCANDKCDFFAIPCSQRSRKCFWIGFDWFLIAGLLATFVAFSIIFFVCFLNYLQAIWVSLLGFSMHSCHVTVQWFWFCLFHIISLWGFIQP